MGSSAAHFGERRSLFVALFFWLFFLALFLRVARKIQGEARESDASARASAAGLSGLAR